MGGTIIVSLGDSGTGLRVGASSPLLGDVLSIVSAAFYAVYITVICLKLPDEDDERSHANMAQFLGFLGLFNLVLFFHVTLILEFPKVESFSMMTWKQFGLIIGKGIRAAYQMSFLKILRLSPTFLSPGWKWNAIFLRCTGKCIERLFMGQGRTPYDNYCCHACLTIQVSLAAVLDSLTCNAPRLLDYIRAVAVMIGFTRINFPSDEFCGTKEESLELETESSVNQTNQDGD